MGTWTISIESRSTRMNQSNGETRWKESEPEEECVHRKGNKNKRTRTTSKVSNGTENDICGRVRSLSKCYLA